MDYTWPSHRSKLLAAEYSKWIAEKTVETINEGDAHFVTFMYHPLPGTQTNKIERMGQDIERIYNRLLTRCVRNPRSELYRDKRPILFASPDLPVYKRNKDSMESIIINDGLHMHGIVVANRRARIPDMLDDYFQVEKYMKKFQTTKLRHFDVQRITHRPEYVADYGLKGLKRPTFSEDDVLVLPRVFKQPDRNPPCESPV